MKKKNKENYKNPYWVKENLLRYKISFLCYNLFSFIVVFVILGAVTGIVFKEKLFNEAKSDILDCSSLIMEDARRHMVKEEIPRNMTVVYYCTEPKEVSQLPFPKITKIKVYGELPIETVTSAQEFRIEDMGKFIVDQCGEHTYLTYVTRINLPIYDTKVEGNIVLLYAKIYVGVDGEMNSQKQLVASSAVFVFLVITFSTIFSWLMMKRSVKPLTEFVNKQMTFVSDASHELRTPLAIVQSKIENVMTSPNKTVYDVSEDLAISLKEISRLTKLTQELLSLARSDKNQVSISLSKVRLDEIVRQNVEPFIEIAAIEDRTITTSLDEVEAVVDSDKVRQVVIILLDNALKYTNPKDEIFVSVKYENNYAAIEVKDTGIGISDETKQKIFERFYREDKARSRETGGNGLGLSIAQTLVQLQNGKIFVDHNVPKGTKFTVYFPKSQKYLSNSKK